MRPKPRGWRGVFEVERKRMEIAKLEAAMGEPGFWADRFAADEKIKRLGEFKSVVDRYDEIAAGIAALEKSFDSAQDKSFDSAQDKDFDEGRFFEVKRQFRALELLTLFRGRYDRQPAVISVYPGAGGDDATDWAAMLFRMYEQYAARRDWKFTVLDDNPNRRTAEIAGDYAYGYLKGEAGVHRLVRISPFSAQKLRHTSFALLEVVPKLPEQDESQLVIPEKDLKIEFSRSSGPGGQNVNKVETAVRIVHLPTAIAVASQAERSQSQNRERALSHLKAKLWELMEQTQTKELSNLRVKVKPEWGNQIRSYVLNPYQLVKDHRTEVETTQVKDVLAGDIDIFVEGDVELLGKNAEGK